MESKERDSYRKYKFKLFLSKITPKRNKKVKEKEFKAKYSRVNEAPMHLAIVLDDIVEDIIHCDERFGILLLSSPEIIEINKGQKVEIDWVYDKNNNKFSKKEF